MRRLLAVLGALLLGGCASWFPQTGVKQTASVVDYLYPDARQAPQLQQGITRLRPPVSVGIAFVPGGGGRAELPEADRLRLLERVKASFAGYNYIGRIEVIPTEYLRPKGGFANLEQVARMFDVEVVTLLSYDQVQFNDANAMSILYWTLVGAYVIHGDRYDIQTMVDASVFDVASHRLLLRAPGTSRIKGSATLVGFGERARAARLQGYGEAIDQLVPRLQGELERFKAAVKSDAAVRIENKPGYRGGGDLGWPGLLAALALAGLARAARAGR